MKKFLICFILVIVVIISILSSFSIRMHMFAITVSQTDIVAEDTSSPKNTSSVCVVKETNDVCKHENGEINILEADCSCLGEKNKIYLDCNMLLEKEILNKTPHLFTTKTEKATCKKEGEIYEICSFCGFKRTKELLKKIPHSTKQVYTPSSCNSSGSIEEVCEYCNEIVSVQKLKKLSHCWYETSSVFATPFKNGTITYCCFECNKTKTETTKYEQNGSVNLCIPSIGMNAEVILGKCNQISADRNDITCDMNFINPNNPLLFGHNVRSFGNLHKIKIGDMIYFTINGKTTAYKVVVSEEAFLSEDGLNIKGAKTGTLCISDEPISTLHFFTCYEQMFYRNKRWIVLAQQCF